MKYVFGNWKMNLSRSEAVTLAEALSHAASGGRVSAQTQLAVFPPICWLDAVSAVLRGSSVEFGGQHSHSSLKGMFTGETSPAMIAELGAKWCLVGHSERRRTFGESVLETAARCAGAVNAGLQPVICVGESGTEQTDGHTVRIVLEQLRPCLAALGPTTKPLIAYEPVWSIGTGRLPTNDQIADVTATLHAETGGQIPVLYGGSVTPDNARELARILGVSGFLVGGSSLDADKFLKIAAEISDK